MSRLNDTAAIVRGGIKPVALQTRAYCGTEPFETPFIPENAFNRKAPRIEIAGPYGAGISVGARVDCHTTGRGGAADRNTSVPGNGGSLAAAVGQVNKSGSGV